MHEHIIFKLKFKLHNRGRIYPLRPTAALRPLCLAPGLTCSAYSQVLPQKLPSQRLGMWPEHLRLGIQTPLPPLRHRRRAGFNPAGRLHARPSHAPQDHVLHGRRGPGAAVCPEGREPERRRVHHAPAARAADVPHGRASPVLRRGGKRRVSDNVHCLYRRVGLSLLNTHATGRVFWPRLYMPVGTAAPACGTVVNHDTWKWCYAPFVVPPSPRPPAHFHYPKSRGKPVPLRNLLPLALFITLE